MISKISRLSRLCKTRRGRAHTMSTDIYGVYTPSVQQICAIVFRGTYFVIGGFDSCPTDHMKENSQVYIDVEFIATGNHSKSTTSNHALTSHLECVMDAGRYSLDEDLSSFFVSVKLIYCHVRYQVDPTSTHRRCHRHEQRARRGVEKHCPTCD